MSAARRDSAKHDSEQLWISEDTIETASLMDDCCREAVEQGPAPENGEQRRCDECGNLWHAEGTIREYRCGCAFGPDLDHLCKEADDLEARSHELVSQWALDAIEDEEHTRLQREIGTTQQQHLALQEQAGRYRDVPERVMFEHSEPDAEAEE